MQRRLGVVGRDPRWAIAWKFPPTTAVTTLHGIDWNVGKFGDLHPFAVLEPVHVGGVTVRKATLHNEEDLRAQGRPRRRRGDRPARRRRHPAGRLAGAARASSARTAARSPEPPARLPVLRHARRSSPRARSSPAAPTALCPERQWQLLAHWVSRGAMDIDGLGEKQIGVLQRRRAS